MIDILKIKKTITRILIQIVIFFVLFEVGLMTFSFFNLVQMGSPNYSFKNVEHFWNANDSISGIWRKPNHSYTHLTTCFSINYKSNTIGARDIERTVNSVSQKRTIVLGDSFAEGWGVEVSERFSGQLESNTGQEFINMGVCNSGQTQQYLIYKEKAKKYKHSAVLWTFFPENDIIDDDISYLNDPLFFKNQYKPFWDGTYPNYTLFHGPEVFNKDNVTSSRRSFGLKNILKSFTYTYHFYEYVKLQYIQHVVFPRNTASGSNGHFNITNAQWNRMKYNIEKLLLEAEGKEVYITTIPSKYDISTYKEEKISVPLRDSLQKLSTKLGFGYYDLLAEFDKKKSVPIEDLYFDCDDHWNADGHRWAAKVMDSIFDFNKTK